VYSEETPKSLCATVDNSGATRRILYELHETLLLRDWETTQWKPDLALRWDVQDRLVPKPGADIPPAEYLIGTISERGDSYVVDPKPGYVSPDVPVVAKKDVESIERGTVLTFRLRPGVLWHDGHPFDANDVAFSWRIYQNPLVECGEKRSRFQKIVQAEVLDFMTCASPASASTTTPSRRSATCASSRAPLRPRRPDNEDGKAKRAADKGWKASAKEQADYVNKNPHNREWVGLGPYKLARWNPDGLEAERFDRLLRRGERRLRRRDPLAVGAGGRGLPGVLNGSSTSSGRWRRRTTSARRRRPRRSRTAATRATSTPATTGTSDGTCAGRSSPIRGSAARSRCSATSTRSSAASTRGSRSR
jgi:hypothetical protein